ncbi:alkaline phosphatase D family protein [uncultured Kordia sp.]|uniref:alkaline phosphatase D family protein n=1 Tax=uncultured Kordia sp. TaxID=507699 RepID=UPI00261B984C|nr:alkaline phosphatase D family protein [uncultured Kordia sp.]
MKRRKFIVNSLLAIGGIMVAPNLISCSNDDDTFTSELPPDLSNDNFNEGVASFDPTSSEVIIWSRYTTTNASVDVIWQVATDINFQSIVRSGTVTTDASRDYTISIELQNLETNQKLYYRFVNVADKTVSIIGETITLPQNAAEIKLAVCSCANFQAGLFNSYKAMAESDSDIIVHLGDYIYEYAPGEYGTTPETIALGRIHEPDNEIVTLDDYRIRYKQYRNDENLKLAHQKKPFICVWDDHEITNDAYKDGAENHQTNEGSYEVRKQAAIQAFSEYLPVRTVDITKIYRSINLGNLVNLLMLDTRVIGRDEQLNYTNYIDGAGNFDAVTFQTDIQDPSRSMLGATQRDWLLGNLASNTTAWKVLGQQVLMGKMFIPAEMIITLGTILAEISASGSISTATLQGFQTQLGELVQIKVRVQANDPTLTPQEIGRVSFALPYNLDAWDGYPIEREAIYSAVSDGRLVCLAGDTHNAWCSNLNSVANETKGKEFATSSVSSPGFEGLLGNDSAQLAGFEQAMQVLIDDLSYLNASQRGYLKMTFTTTQVAGEWVFVDNILATTFNASIGKTETFS